jgi:hypothetical protein
MTFQEILMYQAFALLIAFPIALAFRKSGLTPLWIFSLFIPYLGILICLYILTYTPWPKAPNLSCNNNSAYVAIAGFIVALLFNEPLLAVLLAVILPAWVLVKRAGFSGSHVIWCFLPLLNVIAIWVFGLVNWPALALQNQHNTSQLI